MKQLKEALVHRLFAAIRPPAAIRARLLDAMHGVRSVRWQDEDQLHLTLRFIGEVDRHQAEDVAAALGTIHHPVFTLSLDGIGRFDRRGSGALWAGVTPPEPVHGLHKKIDQACQRVGLPPEGRAFHPHITLARYRNGSGPIDGLIESSGGLSSTPFTVSWFGLYESDLTPDGAVYSVVERYELDPGR